MFGFQANEPFTLLLTLLNLLRALVCGRRGLLVFGLMNLAWVFLKQIKTTKPRKRRARRATPQSRRAAEPPQSRRAVRRSPLRVQ